MSDPPIDPLKARLREVWMDGDFGAIARYAQAAADAFIARLSPAPGIDLLDVACGTGNLSLPAARAGAHVTGIDIAPNLLDQARARALADGLTIRFEDGDAEALPYADASFDLVVSMFGVMFAPDQACAASELLRVCRPGGRIALASWTPDGFIGRMFRLTATFVPPPPGLASPLRWGDPEALGELLAGVAGLKCSQQAVTFELPFPPAGTVDFYRRCYGPTRRTFAALPKDRQDAYHRALTGLWQNDNRATDGTTRLDAAYLEAIARR